MTKETLREDLEEVQTGVQAVEETGSTDPRTLALLTELNSKLDAIKRRLNHLEESTEEDRIRARQAEDFAKYSRENAPKSIRCGKCKGTGRGIFGQGNCNVCGGARRLVVSKGQKCPVCNGSGRSSDGNGYCNTCDTYGKIE